MTQLTCTPTPPQAGTHAQPRLDEDRCAKVAGSKGLAGQQLPMSGGKTTWQEPQTSGFSYSFNPGALEKHSVFTKYKMF